MGALPEPEPHGGAADVAGEATEADAPSLQVVAPPHEEEPAEEVADRPWWSRIRPPDVWNRPAPPLREEVARVRAGEHLPESGPWRGAEQVRVWISVVIIATLLVAIEANRSAGRQAMTLLVSLALVLALV